MSLLLVWPYLPFKQNSCCAYFAYNSLQKCSHVSLITTGVLKPPISDIPRIWTENKLGGPLNDDTESLIIVKSSTTRLICELQVLRCGIIEIQNHGLPIYFLSACICQVSSHAVFFCDWHFSTEQMGTFLTPLLRLLSKSKQRSIFCNQDFERLWCVRNSFTPSFTQKWRPLNYVFVCKNPISWQFFLATWA